MDINVYVILLVFSLLPVVLGLLGRKSGWALIGFFGVSICMVTCLVVASDASITQVCGTSTCTLAAANGSFISDFNIMGYVTPIALAGAEAFIVIRRAFHL